MVCAQFDYYLTYSFIDTEQLLINIAKEKYACYHLLLKFRFRRGMIYNPCIHPSSL